MAGQTSILFDGGIRNGVDVIKAIALGANSVLIGRPWVYAMAAQGEAGINSLLSLFQQEITSTMGLMGVNSIKDINIDLIEQFNSHLDSVVPTVGHSSIHCGEN